MSKTIKYCKPILAVGDEIWPYVELNSKLSKSLASWVAIKNDMEFVSNSFQLLSDFLKMDNQSPSYKTYQDNENLKSNDILQLALFRAAIVTYAKSFIQSKGRNIQLNIKLFKKKPEYKILHEELIAERHSYHSHHGITTSQYLMPILATNPNDSNDTRMSVINFTLLSDSRVKISKYIGLMKFVLVYIQQKKEECERKLYKEIIQIKNKKLSIEI